MSKDGAAGERVVRGAHGAAGINPRNMVLYLPLAYPDRNEFFRILDVIDSYDIGYIELGIPSREPLLDGSVISEAHKLMLDRVHAEDLPRILADIRSRYSFRVVLMTYADGLAGFLLGDLEHWLYDAVLCIDEELPVAGYSGLVHVFTPSTSDEQMDAWLAGSSQFAYVAAGTSTGGNGVDSLAFVRTIERIRQRTQIPIFVGFGIRSRQDIQRVIDEGADGAIIGTELVRHINAGGAKAVDEYLASLRLGIS